MTDWMKRLPDGVQFQGESIDGFTVTVSVPIGRDGLSPLVCPLNKDHRFKVRVTQSGGSSSDCHCPYCGHVASTWDFMPAQMDRAEDAAAAVAEQYIHEMFSGVLAGVARQFSGSSSSGFSMTYSPGGAPAPRAIRGYEIEPTRRSMTCLQCGEMFAVYGLAVYCPECGQLAPRQQFAELVRVQVDRLLAFELLDDAARRQFEESGVLTATLESTFKDGFSALETYLKNRFEREATNVAKQPASSTFQRLDDTNDIYKAQVGVDLRQKAGQALWDELQQAAAIRHVLTHNNGVIDAKFLARQPGWPQPVGQRIQVRRMDVDSFLDALERFAVAVL
jgi:hypothetical protein